jgi:hypothetical protein
MLPRRCAHNRLVSIALATAAACMVAVGCGGAPPPNDQFAATQAAIRAADEVGASEDPQAALHLKLAREGLTKAKALMEEEDNEPAEALLLRAEADAELARTLARKQSTRQSADDAMAALEKLKAGKP